MPTNLCYELSSVDGIYITVDAATSSAAGQARLLVVDGAHHLRHPLLAPGRGVLAICVALLLERLRNQTRRARK